MKLDESIIDQFDLNLCDEREPVNVIKVSELIIFLEESANRIVNKNKVK